MNAFWLTVATEKQVKKKQIGKIGVFMSSLWETAHWKHPRSLKIEQKKKMTNKHHASTREEFIWNIAMCNSLKMKRPLKELPY